MPIHRLKKWWSNIECIFGFDFNIRLFNIYCYVIIFDKLLLNFNINLLWFYNHKILFIKEKYNKEKKSVICNQIDFYYDLPTGFEIEVKKKQKNLDYILIFSILGLVYEYNKIDNY